MTEDIDLKNTKMYIYLGIQFITIINKNKILKRQGTKTFNSRSEISWTLDSSFRASTSSEISRSPGNVPKSYVEIVFLSKLVSVQNRFERFFLYTN